MSSPFRRLLVFLQWTGILGHHQSLCVLAQATDRLGVLGVFIVDTLGDLCVSSSFPRDGGHRHGGDHRIAMALDFDARGQG